jgi:chromosome segregation ATPase
MIPVHSVTSRVEPAHPGTQESVNSDTELGELKSKIERLESEKRDLEIDKEVRTRMNDVLEKNNNRLLEQVKQVSHEAQEWSRKFGQLEERVQHLQLTSPKGSTEKSDTADDGGTEETVNLGDEREMVNDGINHPAKPEGGTIYFEASPRSSSCGYQQPPTGSVGV